MQSDKNKSRNSYSCPPVWPCGFHVSMRSVLRLGLACLATAWAEEEAAAAEEVSTTIVIPDKPAGAFFFEPFTASWSDKWKISKDDDFNGRWKLEPYVNGDGVDEGLVVSDPARKHAVSTLFDTPIVPEGKGLVIQYELQLKNGLQCGGAYLKLLTASEELSHDGFKAETPYTIMFGPDKCGDTNKVHFILRHKSPKTGEWEEKHLVSPPMPETLAKDTHLYTAIVGTDNSVKILVDNVEKKTASLLSDTDFKPTVNPPKEIDDPDDKKPDDWVDDPKMDEPGATKPESWDEDAPMQIADPKASKPSDWLDDAPDMVADPEASMPDDCMRAPRPAAPPAVLRRPCPAGHAPQAVPAAAHAAAGMSWGRGHGACRRACPHSCAVPERVRVTKRDRVYVCACACACACACGQGTRTRTASGRRPS